MQHFRLRSFTDIVLLSRSFVSAMLFYLVHLHSREKRPAVKVNLPDVSRFNDSDSEASALGRQRSSIAKEIW